MKAFRTIKNIEERITINELPPYSVQSVTFDRDTDLKKLEMSLNSTEGIYILYNDDGDMYIGQTNDLLRRVKTGHFKDVKKKMFTNVFAITSRFLNKHLLDHIEAQLIEDFADEKGFELTNASSGTNKRREDLDTFDSANFERMYSVIGEYLETFEKYKRTEVVNSSEEIVFKAHSPSKKGEGTMIIREGKYVTLAGGIMPSPEKITGLNDSQVERYIRIYNETDDGITKKEYTFNAPSFAAAMFTATSVSGWDAWKSKSGKTLAELTKRVK